MSPEATDLAFSNSSESDDMPDFLKPPTENWCFDLMTLYRSLEDEQSKQSLRQLEAYSQFSFFVNGFLTIFLTVFGLVGNIMLVYQIHHTRYFSKRLACHLAMLCGWDIALLMSCLLTYGISCLHYGIVPFVGIVAYFLYFFQPFASFCVTGTIWQVFSITVERYTAVSRPLEQRTRNAQFNVRTICIVIIVVSFLLNMGPMPFERALIDCYEITPEGGYILRTMIIQEEIVNSRRYTILVHLIPDIIFRAPTPVLIIAFLTIRTLQICSNRTIGTQTIHAKRNVPFMLTLLNVKFILCNTLYMFNTILLEILGYGGKFNTVEIETHQFISSLYLTDFSNVLLAVHSATNWLIFYHWPKFGNAKKYSNLTMVSHTTSKTCIIDNESAELLLSRFSANKRRICCEMISTLCADSPHIAALCVGPEGMTTCKTKEQFAQHLGVQKYSEMLADVIEEVLFCLSQKSNATDEIRELCRRIGYEHYEINMHCTAEQWKLVRDVLVLAITQSNYPRWHGSKVYQANSTNNLQKTFIKAFNFALREMKSGALCGVVDASHEHFRQKKRHPIAQHRSNASAKSEAAMHKKSVALSRILLRGCQSLAYMFPRAISLDMGTNSTSVSPPAWRNVRTHSAEPAAFRAQSSEDDALSDVSIEPSQPSITVCSENTFQV